MSYDVIWSICIKLEPSQGKKGKFHFIIISRLAPGAGDFSLPPINECSQQVCARQRQRKTSPWISDYDSRGYGNSF